MSDNRRKDYKSLKSVVLERVDCKSLLCLDVATRWNSTYLMLDVALKFKKVFDIYAELDNEFLVEHCSGNAHEEGKGVPTELDWKNIEKFVEFLKFFYNLTKRISGSTYVTSHTLFTEIVGVECVLNKWKKDKDLDVRLMADRMRSKYEKYWGKIEKNNPMIYIAVILDPRRKLEFVNFVLVELYGKKEGDVLGIKVKEELILLFDEYKRMYAPQIEQGNGNNLAETIVMHGCNEMDMTTSMFKRHKSSSGGENKSEMEKYLGDIENVEDEQEFDILGWWKINGPRFPIFAQMARDVFAIPISTVASESAFSTGGRVLDEFRGSLTPRIVEALICTQDWLRSAQQVGFEENIEVLDRLEEEFSKKESGGAILD